MSVPQAQDPIALISELVKGLNLYSNLEIGNHSNVNTNSNARGASKSFGCKRLNLTESLTWSLCFIVLPFVTFVLWFLCFFFLLPLGVALHFILGVFLFYIYIYIYKRKEGKWSTLCSCTILFVFENKVGQFIFTCHVSCTLFSFDELIYCTWLVETL